jgi:tRNA(Ile)-lysidine synthase
MATARNTAFHPVLRYVTQAVRRKKLLRPGDRVLVAVSGGPDSVCLLAALHEMGERGLLPGSDLRIAHVNYGLRGDESEKDEAFVRELGARLKVPVSCERVRLTPRSGGTLQIRARDARYAFFARMLREHGLTAVATGHTADDQAETVLLWLLRGSGTGGLAGIPETREGRIIRPLLGVTRQQILDYLASRGLHYRSDVSNETPMYRRNRVRHEVLPVLRALNPRIVEALARGADVLAADAALLDEIERERWRAVATEASSGRVVLDGDRLGAEPLGLQRRLVRRALATVRGSSAGLTFRHVSDILERVVEGSHGTGLNLPGGVRVARDRHLVVMEDGGSRSMGDAHGEWTTGVPFPVPGEVRVGPGSLRLLAVEGMRQPIGAAADPAVFVVDGDRLGGPLSVRNWRRGDWFCPSGMGGHRKKLQDFFVDRKVPRRVRGRVPLVVAPDGIVWVAGYRGDERFAARPSTARPLTLSFVGEGN